MGDPKINVGAHAQGKPLSIDAHVNVNHPHGPNPNPAPTQQPPGLGKEHPPTPHPHGPNGHQNQSGLGHQKHARQQLEIEAQGQHFRARFQGQFDNEHGTAKSWGKDGERMDAHPPWSAQARGEGHRNSLGSSMLGYLHGTSEGTDLPPGVRQALDAISESAGRDFINSLSDKSGEKLGKLVERALEHAGRSLGQLTEQGERLIGRGARFDSASQSVRQTLNELMSVAQLDEHLNRLEQSGGNVVRMAEAAIARQLYGDGGAKTKQPGINPAELLRDLRAGLFRSPQETSSPFPLTGRARVVSEMMELMRTLDAIDRATERLEARDSLPPTELDDAAAALKGKLPSGVLGEFEEAAGLLPQLPGRAGREEIPRLIAALNGFLTDADGKPLAAADGMLLKLDKLLWLSTAGGLHKFSFQPDLFPTHLSPLLIYGFDAVYSVIGFDGRTLIPPHFAAVQVQINDSELEWASGQPPLTEGWLRAFIERLKDDSLPDHNVFGEMLEEALTVGNFHLALLRGTVEEGEAVRDSFSVHKLLPGASAETAYSY